MYEKNFKNWQLIQQVVIIAVLIGFLVLMLFYLGSSLWGSRASNRYYYQNLQNQIHRRYNSEYQRQKY